MGLQKLDFAKTGTRYHVPTVYVILLLLRSKDFCIAIDSMTKSSIRTKKKVTLLEFKSKKHTK